MAVGDCERAFARAAAADGIELVRAREAWLNQRGHLGLPGQASGICGVLEDIFLALGATWPLKPRSAPPRYAVIMFTVRPAR